jgi:formylglycine-generating enzyme
VVNVSWNDATAFCQWLSEKEGETYRLPTEAEWEYSCRAGTTTSFSFGEDATVPGDDAWWGRNRKGGTQLVGQLRPNAFGLYDMHGNVREWCLDWYANDYYATSPLDDPTGPGAGSDRVYRGGCWDGPAGRCRSAFRDKNGPSSRHDSRGFRMVFSPVEQSSQ